MILLPVLDLFETVVHPRGQAWAGNGLAPASGFFEAGVRFVEELVMVAAWLRDAADWVGAIFRNLSIKSTLSIRLINEIGDEAAEDRGSL